MLGAIALAGSVQRWSDSRNNTPRANSGLSKEIRQDIKRLAGKAELKEDGVISLESVMAEFKLSNTTLKRMMSHMSDNMDRGLEHGLDGSTIPMLPSFVPELPDGTERGKFVAMDLGGTNLRVMLMELEPGEKIRQKQFNTRIPDRAMHGTGAQLFDYIAKYLADFLVEKGVAEDGLMVGFTFSYPCDQTSLRSATLIRWTKGVTAAGVEGKDVVRLLEEAIARDGRINVEVVALINDTVGTMVAAAYESKGEGCDIGVIIDATTANVWLVKCKL